MLQQKTLDRAENRAHPPRDLEQGFTLIELSIVLVIIGLVIGSVLAGKHLVRQSELQSVIADMNKFTTAGSTFVIKYGALPGDMPDAESYWGSDSNCPNTTTNAIPKTATCNGNGNGVIGTPYEMWRVWQHLANAKLIDGAYTGVAGSGGTWNASIGINSPASRLSGGGYGLLAWAGCSTADANWFAICYNANRMQLGSADPTWATVNPLITPSEAFNLDQKIDDGLPISGRISAWKSTSPTNPNCTTTDVIATSRYDTSQSGRKCSLLLLLNF